MGYTGKPEYMSPEFLLHDDNVSLFAELLSVADANGLYNSVQAELFMLLIEYKRLIEGFAKCRERIAAASPSLDMDQRKALAARFKHACMDGEEITPRLAQFIDYLADMIER